LFTGMSALGQVLLAVVFVFYGFAAVLALTVLKKDAAAAMKGLSLARRVMYIGVGLSVLTLIVLVLAFLTDNFSIAAVSRHSSTDLPFIYKLGALWADSSGSLLLWFVFVSVLFALWQSTNGKPRIEDRRRRLTISDTQYAIGDLKFNAIALAIGSGLCLGFIAILIFMARPFTSNPMPVSEGHGLDPILRNFWMFLHPPLTLISYAAFMIPFVIVLSCVFADITQDSSVYRQLRRWLLFGICFLSLGIVIGMRWSYIQIGWGGFWAWDPVQNISLLPFLVAVAALHSVIGMQVADRFRFWTITLAPLPFIICLFASFVVRSGILVSVHSFDKTFEPSVLSAFIGCCFLLWLFCIIHAVRSVSISPLNVGIFHVDKSEVLFWANVVFIFTAVAIGIATFWPVIWQFITKFDKPFILPQTFYNHLAALAGIVLIFLLGLVSLTDLQKYHTFMLYLLACCAVGLVCFGLMFRFSQHRLVVDLACGICAFSFVAILIKFVLNLKQTSQVAGGIAHLGLMLLVVIVGFTSDKQSIQTVLSEGGKVALGRYALSYDSFKQQSFGNVIKEGPEIAVTKDSLQRTLWPHRCLYPNGRSAVKVDVHMGLFEDVYVSFDRIGGDGNVTITAKVKPLMFWLWFSLLLILAGSVLGMFAEDRETARK